MMNVSVRYIQIPNAGTKPALCFRGRKEAHCVINDETRVRVVEILVKEHDLSRLVDYHGTPYNPELYKKRLLKVIERKGATRRALALLESAEEDALPPDDPADPLLSDSSQLGGRSHRETYGANGSSGRQPKTSTVPASLPVRSSSPDRKAVAAAKERSRSAIAAPTSGDRPKKASSPGKPTLVRQLAIEFKLDKQQLRLRLRKAGLRSPYLDERRMREALKG